MFISDFLEILEICDPVLIFDKFMEGIDINKYLNTIPEHDRFMYLMNNERPSYRTFGYFINQVLVDSIEDIFNDINKKIFDEEKSDLNHLYIDGSKFEANANKYSWVWKKATEKTRYRLYEKITILLNEINDSLVWSGLKIQTNIEYVPDELKEILSRYATITYTVSSMTWKNT